MTTSITSSPAHQILIKQAHKLGWPKYYTDDLTLCDLTHLAVGI